MPDLVLRDHGTLELLDASVVHCGGEEGAPRDSLADVGSNEIKYKL